MDEKERAKTKKKRRRMEHRAGSAKDLASGYTCNKLESYSHEIMTDGL